MIVGKTALGTQVMKDRSVALNAPQRSALILCDGKRSAEDVVKMTAAVGVTMAEIDTLIALGLIQSNATSVPLITLLPAAVAERPITASVPAALAAITSVQAGSSHAEIDFPLALNETILLCSNLGFKGFGLNMTLADVDSLEKLQKLAPDIRRVAGEKKYAPLHQAIFGKPL